MKKASVQYKQAAVIAHGKSERILARFIYTNLHLPVTIIDHNKGKSSIQINGLHAMLSKKPFNNLKQFAEEYSVEYDKKEKVLRNFKLFIIMDTDDCSEKVREEYISGKLFQDCCLRDYIVPIYNSPKLESVLDKAGITTKKVPDSEKGSYYSKVFPINQGPVNNDTLAQIQAFSEKISTVIETNILEYVNYCLSMVE